MATVKDPVCGMELDSSQAPAQARYEDKAYFFCSNECREMFEANPKAYVDQDESGDQAIPLA